MEGRRIILRNGLEIENGNAGHSQGFLWLYFTGFTFSEVASIFLNPENTGRIVYQYGEMEDVYEGFTSCRNIMFDPNGEISVCLVKEE